ncbi:Helix-turn-helix domain containing protein [uncultured Caudovirales phage]|uniref:Helix-turn-helix domain containing protein n=1 Tax=uncultured Caudovirales phage TaxID=2100421 RepID=A0A6J5N373_9CAUD|nr:Helix-turn-helix domain containing protein [uncultured Caudovirales phage]
MSKAKRYPAGADLPLGSYVPAPEAARMLGIRPVSVRAALTRGTLRGTMMGGVWMIPRLEVAAYRDRVTARRRNHA